LYVFYAQSFSPARQNGRKATHGDSVRSKVEAYWPKWLEKPNRPVIQPEDGVKTVDELRKP
jgi:hypothetical protein